MSSACPGSLISPLGRNIGSLRSGARATNAAKKSFSDWSRAARCRALRAGAGRFDEAPNALFGSLAVAAHHRHTTGKRDRLADERMPQFRSGEEDDAHPKTLSGSAPAP